MPSQISTLPAVAYLPRAPRSGVITLFGSAIRVRVDRGHLVIESVIADERSAWRLARVGHNLRRLVLISSGGGYVSLDAIEWLAAQGAALVVLDWDASVLASTGPAFGLDDPRLRRAQALALRSEVGLQIARELIEKKLAGQERVAHDRLKNYAAAEIIAQFRKALCTARNVEAVALLESRAAAEYFSAWEGVSITFSRSDLRRVPEHWRVFGSRRSPISGSQRMAANPLNAILNFLYALLEAEARLAVSAVGLDFGLGILHVDTKARASLADDVLEPVRPQIDDFVLEWIGRVGLKRDWFMEKEDGGVRLMGPFAAQLSETASMWYRAVAPFAEFVARTLWTSMKKGKHEAAPATRLTQARKREVKGKSVVLVQHVTRPAGVCRICGKPVSPDAGCCAACAPKAAGERLSGKAGEIGRILAHLPEVHARISETHRRIALAKANFDPASLPAWLTEEVYRTKIQPALAKIATSAISTALGVTWNYAREIRIGKKRPHPMHWAKLAELVAGLRQRRTSTPVTEATKCPTSNIFHNGQTTL